MRAETLRRMVWRAQIGRWARRYRVAPDLVAAVVQASLRAAEIAELVRAYAAGWQQSIRILQGREPA